MLPARLYPLKYHSVQHAFYHSDVRFNVCPAGRRSGKTEIAKRRINRKALTYTAHTDGRFLIAAPTRPQVKEIYWQDIKAMAPDNLTVDISESELKINYANGAHIQLVGMDRPERAEGSPVDHILLDEFGNMKPHVWSAHIRPALSTPNRLGTADFIGVPEGLNHYHKVWKRACNPDLPTWAGFHWFSSDILDPSEIAEAREELDEETFRQEYEGAFVSYQGRAYYTFDRQLHCESLPYDPSAPLVLCFDFNVSPGVAAIVQEQDYAGCNPHVADEITAVIGEVWIPRHSNTRRVCNKLIEDWGKHRGMVYLEGDATGGEGRGAGGGRHTAAEKSDWAIIRELLRPVFGERLRSRVPRGNPTQRSRVEAMRSRIRSTSGTIRMLVDSRRAPHVVDDLEQTEWLEGGAGELDKDGDRTHISDAIGYYVVREFPIVKMRKTGVDQLE